MVSLALAAKYDKKILEALPVGVYLFMLLSYLLGITGHISHIVTSLILYEVCGVAGTAYMVLAHKANIKAPLMDVGNIIFILMLVLMWIASLHMRITNFDDFHSWAITPKDIYYVNGFPTGDMASTFYRDYFPLVYFMDFLIFKLLSGYRESYMYFVLWSLMLVSLAPFLRHSEDDGKLQYASRVVAGMILPFLVSFQFLHSIGLDILATTIFGSALVYILQCPCRVMNAANEGHKDYHDGMGKSDNVNFDIMRIILAVTVLGMMKTTSLIFSAVCIGVYLVRAVEPRKFATWVNFILLSATTGAFWLSWKAFCRIKGNTTYLSDNLDRNLATGHMGFPSYAASTVNEFMAKLFTYGLNDGTIGLTSAIILVLFIVAFIICTRIRGGDIREYLSFAMILLGMIGYLLVMIYVYLFVFEEWEALSLSSYDRYIATYFGAMLYVALYMLLSVKLRAVWIAPITVAVLIATINFPFVARTLIPSGYREAFGGTIAEIDAIEAEFAQAYRASIAGGDAEGSGKDESSIRPGFGESLLVVDDSDDQLRAKVLPYAAVPGVTRIVLPDGDGTMPSEQEIEERAASYGARIIDLRQR